MTRRHMSMGGIRRYPKALLNRPPTGNAALANEVAQLRAAFDELRAELATEVRTRRLVVVDDAGDERIRTAVAPHSTTLYVSWGDPTTPRSAETSLWVGAGPNDDEVSEAVVNVSTGDDKYVLLQQRTLVDGRSVSDVQLIAGDSSSTLTVGS